MTPRARIPSGTEPATARTAPRLRMVLAAVAFLFFSAVAWALLGAADGEEVSAAGAVVGSVCILIALSAAVDLVILARRMSRGEYRGTEFPTDKGGPRWVPRRHTTADHEEIRTWVEQHEGKPASVVGTADGDEAGILRIDFPGGAGEHFEARRLGGLVREVEAADLTFLYQEQKADGSDSTFFKLVQR